MRQLKSLGRKNKIEKKNKKNTTKQSKQKWASKAKKLIFVIDVVFFHLVSVDKINTYVPWKKIFDFLKHE